MVACEEARGSGRSLIEAAIAEKPREFAQQRPRELEKFVARLKTGDPFSEADVTWATIHATDVRRRAAAAHLKAAQRHLDAARLHERAAALYERSRRWRRGDGDSHLRAIADHTAAAKRRRQAADDEMRRAATEVRRVQY